MCVWYERRHPPFSLYTPIKQYLPFNPHPPFSLHPPINQYSPFSPHPPFSTHPLLVLTHPLAVIHPSVPIHFIVDYYLILKSPSIV